MNQFQDHLQRTISECATDIEALYRRCLSTAPNYGVTLEDFTTAIRAAVNKYLGQSDVDVPTAETARSFIGELQTTDLYLALACSRGNEHAWWEFDQSYRRYIERVARHLASADTSAEEVIDSVYVELYGTRVVDGVRQSKFATYTGRGTLRGWLRTVVWHAVIDLHRASHDEVSIEDWSEAGGEARARPGSRERSREGSETAAIDRITRDRYAAATAEALDESLQSLGDHEKLLLLYYHVENLKLREIARLVEVPTSPLRRWFQRQSKRRLSTPESRVHESTIMRWLEKVYEKIQKAFRDVLQGRHGLSDAEVDICTELATGDLAREDVRNNLGDSGATVLSKGRGE
ncbi:MAG TPA: sigma-70 family RNA polymerase sigma factor [Pyrinomonadaceae bacterium]|nr:sigma-70 family RNA polymerase sigma factor [Pyrinomonadaceae bacterium]